MLNRLNIVRPELYFGKKGGVSPDGSPSALIARTYSGTRVDLYWTNGSTNEDSFLIEASADGVNFSEAATALKGESGCSVTGLSQTSLYYFRVCAVKGKGKSDYTNIAQEVTYATAMTDGHTPFYGRYDWLDKITKDGSNLMTQWGDALGSANVLNNGIAKPKWLNGGIEFKNDAQILSASLGLGMNFTAYFLIKMTGFRADQPFHQAGVAQFIVAWTGGNTSFKFHNGAPIYPANGGASLLNYYIVLRLAAAGSAFTGKAQIDDQTLVSGYVGQQTAYGINLRAQGSGSSWANFELKEILVRDVYDGSVAAWDDIKAYFVKKKLL